MRPNSQQTVLVVEDIDWIRQSMKKVLQGLGYRVSEAADAGEALAAAGTGAPDVILTEEELPTLGALTESVRRPGPLYGVPVAIVNPDEEEGTRYGDIHVLVDFDRLESLLNCIRK